MQVTANDAGSGAARGAAPELSRAPDHRRAAGPARKKKKKKLPIWSHQPIYQAVRTASALVNVAGVTPSMRTMRALGSAYAELPFNDKRLQRAIDNLGWCFPSWDADHVRRIAIEAYRHLFCLAVEVAITPRLLTEDNYARYVELHELTSGLTVMLQERPCILITGHCGNWELLGYTLALLGVPVHALYRPLDMRPLDNWMHETRSRRGLTLVDKFGASNQLPQLIDAGRPVGFIADQNAGDRGLFVPFFNRLASTYKTIGLLALRHNATIICGHAKRKSGMSARGDDDSRVLESQLFGYELDVLDIIAPEDWKDMPDPLFYVTARYRRAIESMVRRAPEQYLWMHRYWKSRPRHERHNRPFPASLREKIASLPWITDDDLEQIIERSARDALEGTRAHH